MLAAARPGAVGQAGHVGAVAGTVAAIGDGQVAMSRLCPVARAAPPGMQDLVQAMPFAAGAQAAPQQGQSHAQPMPLDHPVAIGGTAVASREYAVGASKAFPW